MALLMHGCDLISVALQEAIHQQTLWDVARELEHHDEPALPV